ncbi:hypothetical protein D3C76_1866210 [compost metagenome]
MNGQAIKQVAAVGVEGRYHRRHPIIERLEILNELVSGDAPATDLAVDVNLDQSFFGLDLSLDPVPVLILDW